VELNDALRTTGAVRAFRCDPVPDEALGRVLDAARFAPSGGNRQGWRVVVLRDAEARRRLRDLYLDGWYDYLALAAAGLTPWAPVTDREAEAKALAESSAFRASAGTGPGGFAENLDQVPVLLVLLADLRALAAVDRDLDRYTLAGGASVYPFAWSILLAAREEGLGGVITTMAIRREAEVRELVGAPDELVVAGVVALGYPVAAARRLRRSEVADFTTVDRVDGPAFDA
jgi:nitroreductase